jgi:hypothetical protein
MENWIEWASWLRRCTWMNEMYEEIITFITTNPGVVFFFLLILIGMLAMLYLAIANTPYYANGGPVI